MTEEMYWLVVIGVIVLVFAVSYKFNEKCSDENLEEDVDYRELLKKYDSKCDMPSFLYATDEKGTSSKDINIDRFIQVMMYLDNRQEERFQKLQQQKSNTNFLLFIIAVELGFLLYFGYYEYNIQSQLVGTLDNAMRLFNFIF